MWQPVAIGGSATSLRRRSVSGSSISSSGSNFSARARPRFVPAASTSQPTPFTSTQSSFNAGNYQHAKQDAALQEDAVYPDLSNLMEMMEEQHSWCSSAWINLEMPGEEESRIWGTISQEPNEYSSTDSVHHNSQPCAEPPIILSDKNSSAAPQVRGSEEEYSFETDSDDYDEFDVGSGGVTLDCFDEFTEEMVRTAKAAEATRAKIVALEPSVQEPDTEVTSSGNFTTGSEDDYDGDDDIDNVLQGFDMTPFESPTSTLDKNPWTYVLGKLPFWAQYEATRVALHCGLPLSNEELSNALSPYLVELQLACKANDLQCSWYKIMGEFFSHHNTSSQTSLPKQRISTGLFTVLKRDGWSKTAYMTGSIEFNTSSNRPPFSIRLNALSHQSLNRFWRKYGSDRFLTVRLPSPPNVNKLHNMFYERKILCQTPQRFHEALVQFLMQEDIELLGRAWRLFYVKDGKDKKNKDQPFQAILFAVRGEGIKLEDECEVEELLNWHIPLVPKNLNSTVPKLWSRLSLGLTKTSATVEFTTDQICPDPLNPRLPGDPYTPEPNVRNTVGNVEGEVMDDGCSFASPAVFRKIQEQLGLKEAPTAVQGRLGGAKGLWIVDPVALKEVSQGKRDPNEIWIRVNESQAKYQEHQVSELDPAWTTLDLAWFSHPPKPANVNLQLLAVLDHRGVPFEPLRDLVDEHLELIIQELNNAIDDRLLLRNWVYANGKLSNARAMAAIGYLGSCPAAPAERLLMWLDAGFRPQSQGHVRKELTKMIEGFWESLKEKMHICIPLSTNLFCIADPTDTLKEGEVSLQFSRGIEDPRTGRRRDFVQGDILVARNPAQLPSDIQKVRAVNNEQLRELKDVIVFSRQGLRSLASLLSGGDYDGDKCWICWDPRIVEPFQKEGPINTAFEGESEWFTKYEERVNKLPLPTTRIPSSTKLTLYQIRVANAFLRAGALYTLNSQPNLLGIYSKKHERYSKQFGLADDLAIELAKICAYLVDAPKQGLSLQPDHASLRKKKFSQKGYDDNSEFKYPPADPGDATANIIARLDGFAQKKIAERKVEFENKHKLENAPYSDGDLTVMIHEEDVRARLDPEIKDCLRYLRTELGKVWDKWISMVNRRWNTGSNQRGFGGGPMYSQSQSQAEEGDSFGSTVDACYAEYFMIKPLPEGQTTFHPIISRWMKDAEKPSSEWQLLKASAAFLKWGGVGSIVWYLAGQQLCELKARATGTARHVIEDIYQSLKTDRRFMRKREEDRITFGLNDEEEEIWYDFEDDIPC
ncbi:RNA dependent RNA polymerase-domain-containing protein [Terfezia claveryi]|nr:RNA dependent RNA polymerase-domain-containing protein [Terfezia claveryi]